MAKYKREVTHYLLERIDIIDVISASVPLKKAGRNHKGLCPFHNEKTPSFVVSQERQSYHCFGCGVSGSAISFVMDYENMSFLDALESLADRYNIDISSFLDNNTYKKEFDDVKVLYDVMTKAARLYYKNLTQNKVALEYLYNRGLSKAVIKKFGLGYAPDSWDFTLKSLKGNGVSERQLADCGLIVKNEKGRFYDRFRNRIMFPIFDSRGRVVAFGGRVLDDSLPKYLNSPETRLFYKSNVLYGLNFARKVVNKKKRVFLVEGYMDVITLNQFGYDNTVASLGTALSEHHIKQLDRIYDEVIFAYDNDDAGRNAIMHSLDAFKHSDLKVRILNMGSVKDPDDLLRTYGTEGMEKFIEEAMNSIEFSIHRIEKGYDLKNEDEKLKYIHAVYHYVSDVKEQTEAALHLHCLAETVHLDKQIIYEDFKRWQSENKVDKGMVERDTRKVTETSTHIKEQAFYDSTHSNKVLQPDSNLFKIEKTIIRILLENKRYLEIIKDECKDIYYQVIVDIYKKLICFYNENDDFNIEVAIHYFSLDEMKLLDHILKLEVCINGKHGIKKLLYTHRQLYLQERMSEIDALLYKLKLSSNQDAQIMHREKFVERMELQQQLREVTMRMRSL